MRLCYLCPEPTEEFPDRPIVEAVVCRHTNAHGLELCGYHWQRYTVLQNSLGNGGKTIKDLDPEALMRYIK